MRHLLLIILAAFLVAGCAAKSETRQTYPWSKKKSSAIEAGVIKEGMTVKQVIQAVGLPLQTSSYENAEIWWYPKDKFIYFKKGRVAKAEFP